LRKSSYLTCGRKFAIYDHVQNYKLSKTIIILTTKYYIEFAIYNLLSYSAANAKSYIVSSSFDSFSNKFTRIAQLNMQD